MTREVPPEKVSRNRKPTIKSVKMAVIKIEPGGGTCNCGWVKYHHREKVLSDAAQRHLDKKHGGLGIWL